MNATEACIALNMLATMGPVRLRKLLEVLKRRENFLVRAEAKAPRRRWNAACEVADQIAYNWEKRSTCRRN